METLNVRTTGNGTSGLRALRSAAALLALAAGTCSALAQPRGAEPGRGFPAPTGVDRSGEVSVDDNLTVELHVRDEDLANVLQLLSLQSQKSIIAGPNVNASVTANLYGVTFYEALDAVLHTNGYGYLEEGNMIYVMTLEELDKLATEGRLPVAKIIRLNYLSAVDAAEYVSPLLSDVGEIRTNGRTEDFTLGEENPNGADTYAGASMMIIFDFAENVTEIEALVQQIDTRPDQVLVEATILQASLKEENAFGIDFSVIGDLNFSEFVGGPLNAVNNLISGTSTPDGPVPTDGEGRSVVSNVGQTSQAGGLKIGIVDNDIAVFMRFLDEVTDTTVISNPKILCLNRQQGRVQVGRRIGYLQTTTTDTSTQQSVEFLDTGTQLSFRPWITADREIRMELRPEVSRPFLRTVTDTNGNPITIPDEDTSEIVTNVTVRDGQTIVLGGLFTESTVAGRRQVPFLGDIPIVGTPFRGHNDTVDRAEVIFMIKSTIMSDDTLIEQGRRGMEYVDRARMGGREGLLPWSRERQSSQLIVRAEKLAAEGDMEGALYCVRRSLALRPTQPDAIRLRERLLSEPTVWPTRSMMEDIVNNEVDGRVRAARQQALAEFTSLVRPDNRWENLNSMPAATTTGVNTETNEFQDSDANGFGGNGFSNDSAPADGFEEFDGSDSQNFNGQNFDPQDSSGQTGSNDFQNGLNNDRFDSAGQHMNGSATGTNATGPSASNQTFNGQSFRNNSARHSTTASNTNPGNSTPGGNNYSWSNALSNQQAQTTQPATSSVAAAQPASSQPAASGSQSASQPAAQTSSTSRSISQNNAPSSTLQMFPIVQAPVQGSPNMPAAQPDANGFYPILTASNNQSNPALPLGVQARLAWIFGAKGRQTVSPNPALVPQATFAEVQESESSGNP